MDPADRIAITDVINLLGHLVDAGERYDELFTPDVQYDVTDLGGGVIAGWRISDRTVILRRRPLGR